MTSDFSNYSFKGKVWSQEFTCLVDVPGVCFEDLYPYQYDCTKYWQCSSACISYLRDCPEFLHFSAQNKTCLSTADAMCQGKDGNTTSQIMWLKANHIVETSLVHVQNN